MEVLGVLIVREQRARARLEALRPVRAARVSPLRQAIQSGRCELSLVAPCTGFDQLAQCPRGCTDIVNRRGLAGGFERELVLGEAVVQNRGGVLGVTYRAPLASDGSVSGHFLDQSASNMFLPPPRS